MESTAKINSSLKKLLEKKESLILDVSELTFKLESLNTEYHQRSSSYQVIQTKLEENIKQLEEQRQVAEENTNLRKQLKSSNEKLAEFTLEVEKFQAKEEDSRAELQLVLNDVEAGKQSNLLLQSEYSKLSDQHAVLTEANKSLSLKNESFETRQLVLIKEKDHLQCKYEDLRKEICLGLLRRT